MKYFSLRTWPVLISRSIYLLRRYILRTKKNSPLFNSTNAQESRTPISSSYYTLADIVIAMAYLSPIKCIMPEWKSDVLSDAICMLDRRMKILLPLHRHVQALNMHMEMVETVPGLFTEIMVGFLPQKILNGCRMRETILEANVKEGSPITRDSGVV